MSFALALGVLAVAGLVEAAPGDRYKELIIDMPNLRHLLYHLTRINPTTICVVNVDSTDSRKIGRVLTDEILNEIYSQVEGFSIGKVSEEILTRYRCSNSRCRADCTTGAGIRLKSKNIDFHHEVPEEPKAKVAVALPAGLTEEKPSNKLRRDAEENKEWKPEQDTRLGRNYPGNLKEIIKDYPRYFEEKRTRHGHRLSQQALKLDESSEEFKKVAHELWDRVIGRLRFQLSRGLYSDDSSEDEY